jgi:hypothetical protein
MQFQNFNSNPQSKDFKTWLIRIPLEGNYRTPQSIAINWHQGRLIFGAENESDILILSEINFQNFILLILLSQMLLCLISGKEFP